jgi:type VI secretion system protein VasJ
MPTYREEVAERVAPLLAPIAGANPAGADVSYDPDFEAIKAEIDKLSSVDNVEPAWSRIQELGRSLLTQKGKDLRVVAWMTVAKVKQDTWKGFAESLVLFDTVSRTFWDTMYPEARRARARLNAIAWMADMVNQQLQPVDVTFADGDAVRAADEVLNELDQLLADKLGDAYQGPGQLRSLLRDKVRAIPEPVQAQAAPEAASPSQVAQPAMVQAAPQGGTTIAAPTNAAEAERAVSTHAEGLTAAAHILRAADAARPWSYEVLRRAIWMSIQELPTVREGSETYVPPPDGGAQTTIAEARDNSKWFDLLTASEEAAPYYIFWLDLHRYTATALERLGPQYNLARDAIGREVTHFLARVPNLANLTFSDGTPFADAATKTWLEEEARKHGGGGGGSAVSAALSAEDEEIAKRLEEAQTMVREGKIPEGLAVASALAERAPDGRARFKARLSVGKMALDAPKPELARGMLEHLMTEIDKYGLENWEPALCATTYAYLLAATREVSRARGGAPDLVAKEQYLFDKLCRLDPASAIKLST